MAPRLELQSLLEEITPHVYFQPPENVKLVYPCIIYHRDSTETIHANNRVYHNTQRYTVTVIDRDPDSELHRSVGELPMCAYNRFFITENLNHDVYTLYF